MSLGPLLALPLGGNISGIFWQIFRKNTTQKHLITHALALVSLMLRDSQIVERGSCRLGILVLPWQSLLMLCYSSLPTLLSTKYPLIDIQCMVPPRMFVLKQAHQAPLSPDMKYIFSLISAKKKKKEKLPLFFFNPTSISLDNHSLSSLRASLIFS